MLLKYGSPLDNSASSLEETLFSSILRDRICSLCGVKWLSSIRDDLLHRPPPRSPVSRLRHRRFLGVGLVDGQPGTAEFPQAFHGNGPDECRLCAPAESPGE